MNYEFSIFTVILNAVKDLALNSTRDFARFFTTLKMT